MTMTRSVVFATSASRALVSVVLPVLVPPATRMLARCDRLPEDDGLVGRHDAGGDIVVEREDGDCRLANREDRSRYDRRQQAFEALAGFGQFSRDTRPSVMHLGTDMMGDEADDAFAIGGRKSFPRIGQAVREPVDPEPPIGGEHDLDDRGVFQESGDRRPQRGAQHACTA